MDSSDEHENEENFLPEEEEQSEDIFSKLSLIEAELAEERVKNKVIQDELIKAQTAAQLSAQKQAAEVALIRKDAAIRSAAISSGLVDMDCLALLNQKDISVDDDGNISGIEKAFSELKEKKPFLFSVRDRDNKSTAKLAAAPRVRAAGPTSVRDMGESEYRESLRKIAPSYFRRYN